MIKKILNFSKSKRNFLKHSLRLLGGGLFLSPTIFSINKLPAATSKKHIPSSIEEYTDGKVKDTDVISAKNVKEIAGLLDPSTFNEIMRENREILLSPADVEQESFFPPYFYQATLRNKDAFSFNDQNNVVGKNGKEWAGGLPFPFLETAKEIKANLALGWSRHDQDINAVNGCSIDENGNVIKNFDMVFASQQLSGICNPLVSKAIKDKRRYKHLLKYNAIWFTAPESLKGLLFMNKWFQDQNKFPETLTFNPGTKRMTKLANARRLNNLIEDMNFSLSDSYGFGDPYGVWGNWKVVYRGPFLVSMQHNWRPDLPNWDIPVTGGQRGQSYYLVRKQYIPNIIVIETFPTSYRRPPFAKKRIYVDARNMVPVKILYYDQSLKIIKSIEIGYSQFKIDPLIQPTIRSRPILTDLNKADWNWCWFICKNHLANSITKFHLAESCTGGWRTTFDDVKNNGTPDEFIEKYMTQKGIRQLFS